MSKHIAARVSIWLLIAVAGSGIAAAGPSRYPNELPGYEFHGASQWGDLVPLLSRMKDVRLTLGPPDEARDIAAYTQPYPGDEEAVAPVWRYHDGDWDVLIYFAGYCFFDVGTPAQSDRDLLCSIDLVPRVRIPFSFMFIPQAFQMADVDAPCAQWQEYRDGTGLVYHVYTNGPKYGKSQPGDLGRIVYAPSDLELSDFRHRLLREARSN